MHSKHLPLISVIIPAYNQGVYLAEAIQSVLNQTDPDFEIVVVDDGSTDHTAQVAHSFPDPRVRYVYQQNMGLSAARNMGIRNAAGRYLTFLDSDDRFLPEKHALLRQVFEQYPDTGMAAGQAILMDGDGNPLPHIFSSKMPSDASHLVFGNPFHVGSVLVDRTWQERAGYFDQNLRSYEDWDLWLRMVRLGCKIRVIEQPVSLYRFHPAQMTRNGRQMTHASFAVLDKVFSDPALPATWQALRAKAYANGHLRAAAQEYIAENFDRAAESLEQALSFDGELGQRNGQLLANRLMAWTELPKMPDPVVFLDQVYQHLPAKLAAMRRRRREEVARLAVRLAFQAHEQGQPAAARRRIWQAVKNQPGWLLNQGILSILLRTKES